MEEQDQQQQSDVELSLIEREWKESEYAVYQYTPNRETLERKETESRTVGAGFSLSLVGTSITMYREHLLREHIGIKMSQGTLYKSSGLVANMDPDSFPPSSQSYITRIDAPVEENKERQFLVCFVHIGKQGLDLFRNELDSFSESLSPLLKSLPSEDPAEAFTGSELEAKISQWYSENVAYLARVLQLCQKQLPTLLHIAVDCQVEVTGEDAGKVKDIRQFLEACSLVNLLQLNTPDDMKPSGGEPVKIHVTSEECDISSTESSKFCENWSQVLLTQGTTSPDPFFLRQAIENFKLKIIQDINALKRHLRQAETNYHSLYRCYVFLCVCGNGKLLLQCALQEAKTLDSPDTLAVLHVLRTFSEKHNFER